MSQFSSSFLAQGVLWPDADFCLLYLFSYHNAFTEKLSIGKKVSASFSRQRTSSKVNLTGSMFFCSGEVKDFDPTELFKFHWNVSNFKLKFCLFKPEPTYEYKKSASEREEAFKHFLYMLDRYEIRWKLTWREKKCINQTTSEWKITWFEKLEDRSNFPLPFPQPWGGTRRSRCRRGQRAPGG